MPVRVLPVDTSAAVVTVDPTGNPLGRVGPVIEVLPLDPFVDLVEFTLAHQERKMLRSELHPRSICVVERHAVAEIDDQELAGEVPWRSKTEDVRDMIGAPLFVRAPDDEVIQSDH